MMEELKNDLFYVCTLIEYIGRYTCNHRSDVVEQIGVEQIKHQLQYADVNHSLDMEQVATELIEEAGIRDGEFDTVHECRYKVPSVTSIGKVYQRLVLDIRGNEPWEEAIYKVFVSFLSDEISDFNSNIYYSTPDYLKYSFLEGELLQV